MLALSKVMITITCDNACIFDCFHEVSKFHSIFLNFERNFRSRRSFKGTGTNDRLKRLMHLIELTLSAFGQRDCQSDRHCKYCLSLGIQVLGDKVHFVMICPQFHEDRKCLGLATSLPFGHKNERRKKKKRKKKKGEKER